MPKIPSTKKGKVAQYLLDFPNETFKSDGHVLYCVACGQSVSCLQRSLITQHINTTKHKENKVRKFQCTQNFITSSASLNSKSNFNTDLCRALIKADIPLTKLKNSTFKMFLEKYTWQTIPEESSIRKNYVEIIYNETLSKIRDIIGNGPIWVSVVETTNVDGRYIANCIVGKLNSEPSKPIVLNCGELTKCNHQTIARFFNDAMGLLWPQGIHHENVLLFLSDGAPYMVKAGKVLTTFYPKMLHLTCLAHGFHRVTETVRAQFPLFDSLIATIKKPIITRWSTWLAAVKYYSYNFEKNKDIISNLDSDNSISIAKAKDIMQNNELKNNLAYISANFCFLVEVIKKLETSNLTIIESLAIVENAANTLNEVQGVQVKSGVIIKNKLNDVLAKNVGLQNIKAIRNILLNKNENPSMNIEFTPSDISNMKYAPLTSVDVERSFSRYKSILRPNRRTFKFENVRCFKLFRRRL
ncbi:DUF659 domain-containing protein [Aphis craccivora]|uniref:DUF659 domain-containing protein n=1 Tax=Aphis craccivora TaxID=307492 RepID=A0A6G0Y1D6_APHCR|nr:DUF659 domain-containing protein [Aphis craccivora]